MWVLWRWNTMCSLLPGYFTQGRGLAPPAQGIPQARHEKISRRPGLAMITHTPRGLCGCRWDAVAGDSWGGCSLSPGLSTSSQNTSTGGFSLTLCVVCFASCALNHTARRTCVASKPSARRCKKARRLPHRAVVAKRSTTCRDKHSLVLQRGGKGW